MKILSHVSVTSFCAALILSLPAAAFAGSHDQLSFEVKADTRELCELASDIAFEDIEARLNDKSPSPIFAKRMTVCQASALGGYKKTVIFKQIRQ